MKKNRRIHIITLCLIMTMQIFSVSIYSNSLQDKIMVIDTDFAFVYPKMDMYDNELYFVESNKIIKSDKSGSYTVCDDVCEAVSLCVTKNYFYYISNKEIIKVDRKTQIKNSLMKTEAVHMFVDDNENIYTLCAGSIYKNGKKEFLFTKEIVRFAVTDKGYIFSSFTSEDKTVNNIYLYKHSTKASSLIYSGINNWSVDKGHLVLNCENKDYTVSCENLFKDKLDTQEYDIYGKGNIYKLLESARGDEKSEPETDDNSGNFEYSDNINNYALNSGAKNIVKRARQMAEIEWTPLYDIKTYQYGNSSGDVMVFLAGKTYCGLPYGQPVHNGKYIFKEGKRTISIDEFYRQTLDKDSLLYEETGCNAYRNIKSKGEEEIDLCPYYSTDCSTFVSYAWNIPSRTTTLGFDENDEEYIVMGNTLDKLQTGFALNKGGDHIILVSSVLYNELGELIRVETIEQTPPIVRKKSWGIGGNAGTLEDLQKKILVSYEVIKYKNMNSVKFEDIESVNIDKEKYVNNISMPVSSFQRDSVARGETTISKDEKFVQIEGYSLHEDGIYGFEYSVNGSGYMPLNVSFFSNVYDENEKLNDTNSEINGFYGTIKTEGNDKINVKVRGLTLKSEYYEVAEFDVEIVRKEDGEYKVCLDSHNAESSNKEIEISEEFISAAQIKTDIRGWALSTEGIKRFEYKVDDGMWEPTQSYFDGDVYNSNSDFSSACKMCNSFRLTQDLSYLTDGIHNIYIRGVTDSSAVFNVVKYKLIIENSPCLNINVFKKSYPYILNTKRYSITDKLEADEMINDKAIYLGDKIEITGIKINSMSYNRYFYGELRYEFSEYGQNQFTETYPSKAGKYNVKITLDDKKWYSGTSVVTTLVIREKAEKALIDDKTVIVRQDNEVCLRKYSGILNKALNAEISTDGYKVLEYGMLISDSASNKLDITQTENIKLVRIENDGKKYVAENSYKYFSVSMINFTSEQYHSTISFMPYMKLSDANNDTYYVYYKENYNTSIYETAKMTAENEYKNKNIPEFILEIINSEKTEKKPNKIIKSDDLNTDPFENYENVKLFDDNYSEEYIFNYMTGNKGKYFTGVTLLYSEANQSYTVNKKYEYKTSKILKSDEADLVICVHKDNENFDFISELNEKDTVKILIDENGETYIYLYD